MNEINEMSEVTYRMVDAGSRMASDLITAQVSRSMGGIGGAPAWREWSAAKAPNRDLAVRYADGQIQAVEAIYLAMERARVGL